MIRDRLKDYRVVSQECTQLDNRIKRLEAMIRRGSSNRPHPLEGRYQALVEELNGKLELLIAGQRELEKILDGLEPIERLVLRAYYIEGSKFEAVCKSVQYEAAQIYRIKKRALEKLERGGGG